MKCRGSPETRFRKFHADQNNFRPFSDGRRRRPCRQRRRKKKHLIEAAPFGHIDQILRMTVYYIIRVCPQPKIGGSVGSAPQPKLEVKWIFFEFSFQKISKNIHFASNFGWGALAPRPPHLNSRPQHLIEAAKRGRLDQMLFFRRR